MLPREVSRQRDVINGLFAKIGALPDSDLELKSHWARYLCILIEGHVETAVSAIYRDYVRRVVGVKQVLNFSESNLRKFPNPNMGKILDVTARFSPEWSESLKSHTEGKLKDAVDSVAALRNEIAHGKATGVTYVRIKEYYESVCQVIDFIQEQSQS